MKDTRLLDYLDHIVEATRLCASYVDGMNKESFLVDRRTQQAVILNLIVIGEAATRLLNEYPEFTLQHATIPWKSMKGMRNRIAHGYFDVDLNVVWDTALQSLPQLLKELGPIRDRVARS